MSEKINEKVNDRVDKSRTFDGVWETDLSMAELYKTYVVTVDVGGYPMLSFAHYNGYDWVSHDWKTPPDSLLRGVIAFTDIEPYEKGDKSQ